MTFFVPMVMGIFSSFVLVKIFKFFAPRWGFIDQPNERSSHGQATPRAGGIGIVVAFLLVQRYLSQQGIYFENVPFFIGTCFMVMVSFIDDRWGLPVFVRLGIHIAAGVCVVASGGSLLGLGDGFGPLWVMGDRVVTVLFVVGATNIFNFMDGIDGIAGVQAMIIGAGAGWIFYIFHDISFASSLWVLAGVSFGFVIHNFSRDKIFMGDVGSVFLGYTFSSLAVLPHSTRVIPSWAWVIFLWPFLFDGTFTLFRRLMRRQKVYEAHRDHIYQQLVQWGLSHAQVTAMYGLLSLGLAAALVMSVGYGFIQNEWAVGVAGVCSLTLTVCFYVSTRRPVAVS